jgi:hypothetical protein
LKNRIIQIIRHRNFKGTEVRGDLHLHSHLHSHLQADDSTLQELEMSSCFNTLKEGPVRSVLWNNGISVGDFDTEGGAALVEGLKTNTGLLRLDVSYNKTTSSAWHVALAQAKTT